MVTLHEHSVADRIFEAVMSEAREHDARGIAAVTITVGEMAGVAPEALVDGLRHCCEHAGIAAFPVEVVVERTRATCRNCGRSGELVLSGQCCFCGSTDLRVAAATGIRITQIEFAAQK